MFVHNSLLVIAHKRQTAFSYFTDPLISSKLMMQTIPTWLDIPADSDFSIHNLPFGIFSTQNKPFPRIGVAIGEYILDLHFLVSEGALDGLGFDLETLQEPVLNSFMALGWVMILPWAKMHLLALRSRLTALNTAAAPT